MEPEQLRRGKEFEKIEKSNWVSIKDGKLIFEQYVRSLGDRNGRIDIFIDALGGYVSIIEIKATDWDKILPHRIDANIQCHARQIWKYVEPYVESGIGVCPGAIYPKSPCKPKLKQHIEKELNDCGIQVVWRNDPN